MKKITDKDLEMKFFGAELRGDLPSLDLHPPTELHQVEIVLDRFFCQQIKSGESVVAIIYGGGTGMLEKTIFAALKRHPLVVATRDKGGHCLVILEKAHN